MADFDDVEPLLREAQQLIRPLLPSSPSRAVQPFLDLPNVIASPHNSAQGTGAHNISLRRAVENCRRALTGEAPLHVIGLDER
jgi:phosphoglycerate dehydrogenase-like enzyme